MLSLEYVKELFRLNYEARKTACKINKVTKQS